MGKRRTEDICDYYHEAFGFDGFIEESARRVMGLFSELGIPMFYGGRQAVVNGPMPFRARPNSAKGRRLTG